MMSILLVTSHTNLELYRISCVAIVIVDHHVYVNVCVSNLYRPFHVGVASRLATAIYVAMVTPILYDNSYSLNDSNLKYESYRPYG